MSHNLFFVSSLCKVEFLRGKLLSYKFSIVFKPCFANAVFSVRRTRVNKLKKKKMSIAHVQLTPITPTSKHLPVYIYIHSTLIEPVEITTLQLLIIIIDHCVIHSPILNIMIYLFKKNQRMTPPFKGHKLWSEICSYHLCCNHFFCGKLLCLLWISKPHVNLFLPVIPLFLNFLYSSNYLCQTKNIYKTLPHYKLQSGAWKSQNI